MLPARYSQEILQASTKHFNRFPAYFASRKAGTQPTTRKIMLQDCKNQPFFHEFVI